MKNLVFILGLSALAFSGTINAQNMYVSDQLEAALRRGEGLQFKVIRMVRSGEELVVLKESQSGYTKVRTSNGREGYILSRYLMPTPAARKQLETYQVENQQLKESVISLEQKLSDFESTVDDQNTQITNLQSDKTKLDADLGEIREATADVLVIKRKNTELEKEVMSLTQEKDVLSNENHAYRNNTKQDWFLRGAGVILVGIFIGLILPKMRKRRRWGEL